MEPFMFDIRDKQSLQYPTMRFQIRTPLRIHLDKQIPRKIPSPERHTNIHIHA